MRLTITRRRRYAAGLGAFLLLLAFVLAGRPLLRGVINRAAERRGLVLKIGGVWPALGGVVLRDTEVTLEGVPGVLVHVDEARVEPGFVFGPQRIALRGARAELRGTGTALAGELAGWRARREHASAGASRKGRALEIALADGALSWREDESAAPRVELHGIGGTRTGDGAKLSVDSTSARWGAASVTLQRASAQWGPDGSVTRAHAALLALSYGPSDPRNPGGRPEGTATIDVSTPLVELPDLRATHALAMKAVSFLSGHLATDSVVDVDSVTWNLSLRGGSTLTVGPGGLTMTHDPSRLHLDFVAGATDQGPALIARATLPVVDGDAVLDLQGGPVSLAALGVQAGAAGLFDVAHANVSGRGHLAIDPEVRDLTFDWTGAARGISIRDPLLATEDVRGLDVQLRARGALSMPGNLRFDDLAATVGALRVEASGMLAQESDHVAASFRVSVPTTPCSTVLASIPTALLPVASTMTFGGDFGADGRIAFDSRSLDDLALDYEVRDRCRVNAVPHALARETFRHPFTHRVYLPDGTTQDEETGPGTATWTQLDQISPFMEVAVTTTEDGAFRSHHGFNRSAIKASLIANLKARRFVRGASTITMQLAKNLFLSREKTLSRKLEEVILSDYLEQILSKDEILELYLNVVEFGPAVYGVTAAADYYYGRSPAELDAAEAFFLASVLPSPLRYTTVRDSAALSEPRLTLLRSLMRAAQKRGLLTDEELAEALREPVEFWHGDQRPAPRPSVPPRAHRTGAPENDVDSAAGDTDSSQ